MRYFIFKRLLVIRRLKWIFFFSKISCMQKKSIHSVNIWIYTECIKLKSQQICETYLQCENLLKCYFHTLNVSLVNPYMIGFAKLLLMANQWAPRKRASFCWCGTSLKTSVKSPMRLNKWRGNQQIPNITTTMTNILTTWNERKGNR